MKEIYLTSQVVDGEIVWLASASNHEGVIEYVEPASPVNAHTPLDAMTRLAEVLYDEVVRLTQAYEFEHVPAVNRWLRDCAVELRTMPDDIDSTARSVRLIKAEALETLADTEAAP
jgi:hypothetical protein